MASRESWRRRNHDSTSSGYSTATVSSVSSRGLYRNMSDAAPPPPSPPKAHDPGRFRGKKQADPEDKIKFRDRQGLPCYVKSRRSTFETDDVLEVRLDETNKKEVWIRATGFPSQAFEEALKEAELIPLQNFQRAYPALVVTEDGEQRRRGLLMNDKDDSPVEYLDVDSGRVEKIGVENVFAVPDDILSIPNAAIRCKLDKNDEGLDHKLFFHKEALSDWTKSRVHFTTWGNIPTVLLDLIEPNFDTKKTLTGPVQREQKVQKLYKALPGILIPPAYTLLKNCSVLHVEERFAYIAQNDTPFEIDPSECGDLTITPSLREKEQLYLPGDCVIGMQNEIEMRVVIGDSDGSSRLVQSVDSGATSLVWDLRALKPLHRRDPPKALKVALPPEYCFRRLEELEILLRTGVFDVFFEDAQDPPLVRLFTPQGQEMPVCVSEKANLELDHAEIVSEDDRGSTRSARG